MVASRLVCADEVESPRSGGRGGNRRNHGAATGSVWGKAAGCYSWAWESCVDQTLRRQAGGLGRSIGTKAATDGNATRERHNDSQQISGKATGSRSFSTRKNDTRDSQSHL